jgi:tripartite-type tricarboxylate transporter receptor subunit TctC
LLRRAASRGLILLGAVLALGAASDRARAQAYPDKPVKLVLPYAPGGIIDFVGRTVAQKLGDELKQPVVAENRPGAGGINGTDFVARAAPDGYTLLLMDPAVIINPSLQPSIPYDFFKQLQTVTLLSSSPEVLVVSHQLGVKSIKELVAYGKANPGKLNFASAGIGTTPHLAGEMFKVRTGIDAVHVPYRGIGQSFTDMMSGKIQFAFSSIAGARPFTTDNRILPIATTGRERSPVYPDTPTVIESGLADFEVDLWLGIFVPAGTPAEAIATLNAALKRVLADEGVKAAIGKVGVTGRGTSAEEGAAFMRAEHGKWAKVIKDANVKPE